MPLWKSSFFASATKSVEFQRYYHSFPVIKDKYKQSEEDRKRCKATLERLRYELNSEDCDCGTSASTNSTRNLDLAQVETEECSLVTVLASDGYTCITSPVISNRSIAIHETSEDEKRSSSSPDSNKSTSLSTGSSTGSHKKVLHCNGGTDSGLSSEEDARHHLSSSSSSSNDEIKVNHLECISNSDKSSYSEKQEKLAEEAKENHVDRLQGKL